MVWSGLHLQVGIQLVVDADAERMDIRVQGCARKRETNHVEAEGLDLGQHVVVVPDPKTVGGSIGLNPTPLNARKFDLQRPPVSKPKDMLRIAVGP